MMMKLFAVRLAEAGIRCYEVRPGIIRTEMTQPAAERYDKLIADGIAPIRRWGEPDDVGRAVALLASGELNYSTGEAIRGAGGCTSDAMTITGAARVYCLLGDPLAKARTPEHFNGLAARGLDAVMVL